MKSTQDLCIWLNKVASHLKNDLMAVEIFSDKSFRISKHNGHSDPITVYDSDSAESPMDINDLPYTDPEDFANECVIQSNETNP